MPTSRKKVLKSILSDIVSEQPEDTEVEQPQENVEEQTTSPETFSFSIPSDKVPLPLKEMQNGQEVTLQITGFITSNDDNGVSIDIRTIEVL